MLLFCAFCVLQMLKHSLPHDSVPASCCRVMSIFTRCAKNGGAGMVLHRARSLSSVLEAPVPPVVSSEL
jgi:hypothetical protein